MFYEELYPELGKLFYYMAAADGNIHPSERKSLQQLIQSNWKPMESSVDQFGTDQASLIDFAFDFEEAEGNFGNEFQSFETFYLQNKSRFNPVVTSNILQTCKAIASAYRGKNKNEKEVLDRIIKLFNS